MGGVWDGEIKAGGLPFEFSWLGVFYCKAFKSMDSSNYFFNQDISYLKKKQQRHLEMRRSWQKRALSSHGNDASAKS